MICWQPCSRFLSGCLRLFQGFQREKTSRLWPFAVGLLSLSHATLPAQTIGVLVEWDPSPSPEVVGYRVYYGGASGGYTNSVSVGNVTSTAITGLSPGVPYYFAGTAVTAEGLESGFSNEVSYSGGASATNTAPTISAIPNQVLAMNVSSASRGFTVGDIETAAGNLSVSASSSNPTLVPAGGIVLGGSGSSRLVTITPALGQYGAATISLVVSDGTLSATSSFTVTINPPPSIVITAPNNGQSYTAPAIVNMAATVSANGNTLSRVQFFSGSTLLGEDTAAPFTWSWGNVAAGSYSLTARLLYNGTSTVTSGAIGISVTNVSVVANPPAPPWKTVSIGPGNCSATESNGRYNVSGQGAIAGVQDTLGYLYQHLSADGQILTQITSIQGNSGSFVGLMIRESLTPESRFVMIGVSPDGRLESRTRLTTGGGTVSTLQGTASVPGCWLKLVRRGRGFQLLASGDGAQWTPVGRENFIMSTAAYIGLAVSSGDSTTITTTSFENINIVP